MPFFREELPSVTIIRPVGSLDLQTGRDLRGLLDELDQEKRLQVLFDLAETEFIDSSSLTSFISFAVKLRKKGGDLKLARIPPPIQRMFQLVRLGSFLDILPSLEEAIEAFSRSPRQT